MKTILITLIFLISSCHTQNINTAELESLFHALEKNDLAIGSLAIAKDGKLLYQNIIGDALKDTLSVKANDSTKYKIGSVTKTFTAVMIFQLIEEGKLRLEDPLDKFFPEIPNSGSITIANLLNHQSGLPNYTEGTNFDEWMDNPRSHDELIKLISQREIKIEPGTKTVYCNSNYLLLSYIIEKVTQIPYEQALKERIVNRIGLKHTYYGGFSNIVNNESLSYTFNEGIWMAEKETHPSIHSGAGGIVSNPTDLIVFMNALISYQLISKQSFKKMKALKNNCGMGFWGKRVGQLEGFGHGGKTEGFLAELYYFPEEKLTVAYCTNGYVYPVENIFEDVINILSGKKFMTPDFNGITMENSDLDPYLGTYKSTPAQPQITVNCTKKNNRLIVQTQDVDFAFIPIGNHEFMNKQFGYFFEFDPEKETLLIKEKANVYFLKKEN